MKFHFVTLFLVANIAWAETPQQRAELYFSDIENLDFLGAASHFDAEQLKEFRGMMEFYKEMPEEAQTNFVQTFFGPDQSTESLENLSDLEFFSGLFSFIMKQAEAAGGLNFDGIEILGEVKEGDDITHLVTRTTVSLGAIDMEAMEVVSLKKSGEEWRILMSGKIKGLPQQLRAAYAAGGQ